MIVRKVTNVSKVQIPIVLNDQNKTTIYLPPKGILENVDLDNYLNIQKFAKVELDLSEINEKKKGKQYLKG